jgi:hypothetical protein
MAAGTNIEKQKKAEEAGFAEKPHPEEKRAIEWLAGEKSETAPDIITRHVAIGRLAIDIHKKESDDAELDACLADLHEWIGRLVTSRDGDVATPPSAKPFIDLQPFASSVRQVRAGKAQVAELRAELSRLIGRSS